MAHAWVTAGYGHWDSLRQLAGELGMRLDESKGFLSRTFTYYGTDEQVRDAYAAFQRLRQRSAGPVACAIQAQKDFVARCERDGPPDIFAGLRG